MEGQPRFLFDLEHLGKNRFLNSVFASGLSIDKRVLHVEFEVANAFCCILTSVFSILGLFVHI